MAEQNSQHNRKNTEPSDISRPLRRAWTNIVTLPSDASSYSSQQVTVEPDDDHSGDDASLTLFECVAQGCKHHVCRYLDKGDATSTRNL
jgi:hypothetical protein